MASWTTNRPLPASLPHPARPFAKRESFLSGQGENRGTRVRSEVAHKPGEAESCWRGRKHGRERQSGKLESWKNQSFAGSVPAFLLSRSIRFKERMAPRCIAGQRSAGASSCRPPRDLLAPYQVRLGETEHNSAKWVRHFRSHPRNSFGRSSKQARRWPSRVSSRPRISAGRAEWSF